MAALLLLVGGAALTGTFVAFQTRDGLAERPHATGDIGFLLVYGQMAEGPTALQPDRLRRLPRPQDFAFQFVAGGSGPRLIRLEIEEGVQRTVMFEERVYAPATMEALDYVMHLDEKAPDNFVLVVTVEAPHAVSAVSRYPVQLEGKDRRFWDPAKKAP